MNTTQLECFLAVADCLNFSRAAEHLRLTQPAVSHQIKTLEDELEVELFKRSSKSVELTREGHMFLQYAGDILHLTGLSKAQVRKYRRERPEWLSIGCRSAGDLKLMKPALERLRREESRILPLLKLIPFSALDNLLAEGEIQMMLSFKETLPANCTFQPLLDCKMVCVCREDHLLAAREETDLESLREAGRLASCPPPVCPPSLFSLQGQLVTARAPDQVLFCENQEVLLTMVETGYAFALAVDIPQLRRPGLRYIPLAGCRPLPFGAAARKGNSSPAARRFITLLKDSLSDGDEC